MVTAWDRVLLLSRSPPLHSQEILDHSQHCITRGWNHGGGFVPWYEAAPASLAGDEDGCGISQMGGKRDVPYHGVYLSAQGLWWLNDPISKGMDQSQKSGSL